MKIFLSSTVYDLLDIRAELSTLLSSMGIFPLRSDEKLSEFNSAHDTNSIETCLINVADSDEVIIVLDQRYGQTLGRSGFPDVSATHLEYRKARELKKPVHVFVRDRLEADFTTWKKNKRDPNLKLSWVEQADYRLFELLEEHRKLSNTDKKNWFSIFNTSVDLKNAVRRLLEPRIKPASVIDAISQNRFPLFDVDHESEFIQHGNRQDVKVTVRIRNIGGAAAFNFALVFSLKPEEVSKKHVVAPGQTIERIMYGNANNDPIIESGMSLEFDSVIGVKVRESYDIQFFMVGEGFAPTMMGGVFLKEKSYHNAPDIQVVIQD